MKTILNILKNYKFVKKDFYKFLIIWILSEIAHLWIPKMVGKIVEIIEKKQELSYLYTFLWAFTLFLIMTKILSFSFDMFWNKIRLELYYRKMQHYRKKLFEKNYKDIIDSWTWKLITRYSNWVSAESDIFSWVVEILISAVFRWILIITILAIIIPKLITVVVIAIIILFILNYYVRKYSEKYRKREQELWETDGRIKAKVIMENLVIRVFWKQNYELKKSESVLSEIVPNAVKTDMSNFFFYNFLDLLLKLLEIWVYVVLWTVIIKWGSSISYLVMVTWYIVFLSWPLHKAVSNLVKINRVWEKYIKLQEFVNKPIEIKDWIKEYNFKKWKIELKNISFSYWKWKEIFKDFNLEFSPQKKTALVWQSWWWKSTITKILLRLYDYEKWEVLIDWQDLKELKMESFYKHIGYLSQDPAIFDWTIRENMEYALSDNHDYDDEIIWEALKKAQIDDMIKNLENWLNTEVWEKWIKLSWWEKQRLAIARIFLKNPAIIILDEPTSALDSFSEELITKAMHNLFKDRTVIIIAHRLQTVKEADKIFVIEDWKIKEEWNHKELIHQKGVYKRMLDLQSGF